jgi:hypothetical protein
MRDVHQMQAHSEDPAVDKPPMPVFAPSMPGWQPVTADELPRGQGSSIRRSIFDAFRVLCSGCLHRMQARPGETAPDAIL